MLLKFTKRPFIMLEWIALLWNLPVHAGWTYTFSVHITDTWFDIYGDGTKDTIFWRLCNGNNCGIFVEQSSGWPTQGTTYTHSYTTPSFLGIINRIDIIITGSDCLGIDWIEIDQGDGTYTVFDYGKWYMEYTGGSSTGCQVTTISSPNNWNYAGYDYCIYNDLLGVTYPPTPQPTIPTFAPTKSTEIPTSDPTNIPSMDPSSNPTDYPSVYPSLEPTTNPTNEPTISTLNPSINPTIEPSLNPTFVPSNIPTVPPTNKPTEAPVITDGVVSTSTTRMITPNVTESGGDDDESNQDLDSGDKSKSDEVTEIVIVILWIAGVLGILFIVTLSILICYCCHHIDRKKEKHLAMKEGIGEVECNQCITAMESPMNVSDGEQYALNPGVLFVDFIIIQYLVFCLFWIHFICLFMSLCYVQSIALPMTNTMSDHGAEGWIKTGSEKTRETVDDDANDEDEDDLMYSAVDNSEDTIGDGALLNVSKGQRTTHCRVESGTECDDVDDMEDLYDQQKSLHTNDRDTTSGQ